MDYYEDAACGYLSATPAGVLTRVNRTFLSWIGRDRSDVLGRRFSDLLDAGGRIYHETHYDPLLRMQGSVRSVAFTMVRMNGSLLPVLVDATLHPEGAGIPACLQMAVFDASARREYERELVTTRRSAERSARRLRLVEQVVGDLAAVTWPEDVVKIVSDAGRGAFGASTSGVWLLEQATGELRGAAASGLCLHSFPVDLPADSPAARNRALRRGEVVVVGAGDADLTYPFIAGALGAGTTGTLVLVPVAASDRTSGILAMRFDDDRELDTDQVALLQTLGRQAGQALERAQLTEQLRTVSTVLQSNLLPEALPHDDRIEVAPVYRPSVAGLDVGGDWYDAFWVASDVIAVSVGDVAGRGLAAASAMGQLRSAIRALAGQARGPGFVLSSLDAFVEGLQAAQAATVAYLELNLSTGEIRQACAGHLPPVVMTPDGDVQVHWRGRSAPLGGHLSRDLRPESGDTVPAGSRIVLYTDGLVERPHRGLDAGIEHLVEVLAKAPSGPAPVVANTIVDDLLADLESADDVCLLMLDFHSISP